MFVPRYIEPRVQLLLQRRPVVVIEGARAVGKTSLISELTGKGVIRQAVSLTDRSTLSAALDNPESWLSGLQQPFAVDEAQLAPALPIALKSLLDRERDNVRCVLTGSASIGRTGLGGADPLARRSAWLTLEPLSEAELASRPPWSAIDQLFGGMPRTGARATSEEWTRRAQWGGMPSYRLSETLSDRDLFRTVLDDVSAVLTDHVLPDARFDTRTAQDVLLHVLRSPAGELKVEPIGNALGLDRRTVNRYLDILERRYLLTELPNYRRPSKQGTRATAKVYPADTALSAAALASASRSSLASDKSRGGLMEAHVVQQLRAHRGWTELDVQLFHWREARQGRTSEVDVVIEDSDGRIIAIEVKSGSSSRRDDFRGIRALRERFPHAFHRGFVVVGEGAIAPADEDGTQWRIPVSALSDPQMWEDTKSPRTRALPLGTSKPTPHHPKETPLTTPVETRIFMSYAHTDQESATGGDLRQFAADVEDEMQGVHERPVRIITDQNDVLWGDGLWDRLNHELDASIYLLPFITPRYLQSDACRSEFERFDSATASSTDDHRILPLIWIAPKAIDRSDSPDGIIRRVRELKYVSAVDVRTAERTSSIYREHVGTVAERLEAVIAAHEESLASALQTAVSDDEVPDSAGLDDIFVKIEEEDVPTFTSNLQEMLRAFEVYSDAVGRYSPPAESTPRALRDSLASLARDLQNPSSVLERASGSAADSWKELVKSITDAARISEKIGQPIPSEIRNSFEEIAQQIDDIEGIPQLRMIASSLPQMSSRLIPASRAMTAAIRTLDALRDGARSVPGAT